MSVYPRRNYCTFFDRNYLSQGIVLYNSLVRNSSKPLQLWVLCMDDETYSVLESIKLEGLKPLKLSELEAFDPELANIKETRSKIEYFFTCTPCLPRFILTLDSLTEGITYIDADLYFFNDPELIYQVIGDSSISITPHRYSQRVPDKEKWGKYNVAFIYFRRDENGQSCIEWWRKSCIEWCYDRAESGKFADQGYLNDWPERFQSVCVLENPGINLALWNLEDSKLSLNDKEIQVNNKTLIFYHFHLFKKLSERFYKTNIEIYSIQYDRILLKCIYQKYANEVFKTSKMIGPVLTENTVIRYDDKKNWTSFNGIKLTELMVQVFNGKIIIAW